MDFCWLGWPLEEHWVGAVVGSSKLSVVVSTPRSGILWAYLNKPIDPVGTPHLLRLLCASLLLGADPVAM